MIKFQNRRFIIIIDDLSSDAEVLDRIRQWRYISEPDIYLNQQHSEIPDKSICVAPLSKHSSIYTCITGIDLFELR